jgi:hypothetical protein
MELFLVADAAKTKRAYTKGILDARRKVKEFGKGATLIPVKVTLTKDGVLAALNAVPFNRRVPGPITGALLARNSPEELADLAVNLRPDNWREILGIGPGAVKLEVEEIARFPTTGYYNPRMFPEDYAHLKDKHPRYVLAWNQSKQSFRKEKRA